jgi:WD40 repeat protein
MMGTLFPLTSFSLPSLLRTNPPRSCSSIRVWNYRTGDALTTLGAHDSFVYALAALPSMAGGGLASAGEDGIVKIWNEEDGEEDQEILIPALSGRSSLPLPSIYRLTANHMDSLVSRRPTERRPRGGRRS